MTTDTDRMTDEERAAVAEALGRPLREWETTGKPQRDDDGAMRVLIATCGTCGRKWNDALITEWTPTPAARCPFEYEHEDDDDRADDPERRHPDAFALDQIAEVLRDCDWSEVLYDDDALDTIHGILVNAGRDPGPGVDDDGDEEELTDRDRRWRDLLAEYDGIRSDEWGPDDNPLDPATTPAPANPIVLVETNQRGSDPPYWLTTYATANDAAAYTVGQEYAEDWDATTLIDLDTGTLYRVETTATAVADPIP